MLRFLSRHSAAITVILCLGLALFLRIVVPYALVFTETGVRFAEADPYSHMRLVDNALAHFPTRTAFDPYTYFPEGAPVYYPPLFTLFLSGFIWLFSLGAPTAASTDILGALFPAILGSLTVIPVFFTGKALFGKWAGALAALLIAIMPGEVLGRTMLGFTDHHVIEILFTTTGMMFLALGLKTADTTPTGRDACRTVKRYRKPLLFGMAAGLSLGLYLQMWAGGPIFILILAAYFVAQSVINHLRQGPSGGFVLVTTAMMLTASAITLPFLPRHYSPALYFTALGVGAAAPAALAGLSWLLRKARLPRFSYPVCLALLGVAGYAAMRWLDPELLASLLGNFGIITPGAQDLTIGEVQPLLFPDGGFSLSLAWLNFTTGFFLAPIALGALAYQAARDGVPGKTLLVVWSLCTLGLSLAQRRFSYYYAVNVSLLTACLAYTVLKRAGLNEVFTSAREKVAGPTGIRKLTRGLVLAGVMLLVIAPNVPPALATVKQVPFAPDDAWVETLNWLRGNSPPPLGANDLYYKAVEKTNPGQYYDYPEAAYGVMAWWDYGHWITRIAHRLPNHAPGGGRSPRVAECLLAQEEATSAMLTSELDSLYVIADYTTAIYRFHGVATFAGKERSQYFDQYYQEQNGVLKSVVLFYPEYYQTLLARLYFFDGKAVTPEVTTVIAWEEKQTDGIAYKEVTSVREFQDYGEARAYVDGQAGRNLRIVSTDPFSSPVPLAALDHYRLVYSSVASSTPGHSKRATPVKVFVYLSEAPPTLAQTEGNRDDS